MKNITKTTLFVSLIAAIILPFSVMSMIDAVPSENTNDNTTRTYEVEVISTEILDESYVDGVKVTKYKQTVRQTDMPTLEDFTEDNREYFDFLIDEYGEEGRNLVEQTKSEFTTDIENVRDQYEIEVMKYGEHSITFEPKTRASASFSGTIKDPINIVFWHDGRASEARFKIDYNAPHNWHWAAGGWQYVYVDETSHGGTAHWQINNFQLQEGSFSDRYHLRIFNGGNSNHDSFKYWAIGAVHKETWDGSDHVLVPNAWEISEAHLKSDLSSTTGILSVGTFNLANSGSYQGIWNNGVGGYIKVQ